MRVVAAFASLVSLLAVAPLHAQTTWYVDANATPPGDGSEHLPYASLQYAVEQPNVLGGHTVLVAPGAYGPLDVDKFITIRSTGGPAVTSTGAVICLSATFSGFTMPGDGYFDYGGRIDHCIVRGSGGQPLGLMVHENGSVRNCVVQGFATGVEFGVWASGNNLLENTILLDCSVGARALNSAILRYCAGTVTTQGTSWTLSNNLPGTPGVWDSAAGDFHLRPLSVCVNAGNPATATDPDGSRADIGAIPFDASWAPFPVTYCTGKVNSQGCVPAIGFSGVASYSDPSPFLVTATNVVPHRRGFVFYGFAPDAVPFQGATYCVLQPTRRTKGQDSLGGPTPCTGTYSFDFNQRIQAGGDPALVPGAVVYAQYWFRDPADVFQSGLSDGLCFRVEP